MPHRKRNTLLILLILVVVLVGVRAALPYGLQWYVNRTLDRNPEYAGHVGDVDLAILRGAYRIDDVQIEKTTADVPVPFFSAQTVEFSVYWNALFNGSVVGEMRFLAPVLNIVDSESEENEQTGEEGNWLAVLDELFPLRIDRVLVEQGQLHFRNFESEPPVDVYLSDLNAVARNLTNSEDLSDSLVSTLDLSAVAMGSGELTMKAELNLLMDPPAFDVDARLLDLPVMRLDDLIAAYAPFDVEAGTLDVVTEMAARDGLLEGYVKPIVYNLEVFDWKGDIEEDKDNPIRALWEGLVGLVGEVVENQPRDQVATNVPFSGSLESPETSVWATISGVLRNAFVEAFRANLEDSVSLNLGGDEAEEAEEAGERPRSDAERAADRREATAEGGDAADEGAGEADGREAARRGEEGQEIEPTAAVEEGRAAARGESTTSRGGRGRG